MRLRRTILTVDESSAAVAALEPSIASLTNLAQSGRLGWNEDFVVSTLRQIELWRERDEANPQIFELLVADLVRKLIDDIGDVERIRAELIALGADDALANDVATRVSTLLRSVPDLIGTDDARADGAALETIASNTERIAAGVETLAANVDKSKSIARRAGEAAAIGAAEEVGKAVGTGALSVIRSRFRDDFVKLSIDIVIGLHRLRDILTSIGH